MKNVIPDLQIFVSKTESSPSAMKCEQNLTAPSQIFVYDKDKKTTFKSAFNIYLTFFSLAGVSI